MESGSQDRRGVRRDDVEAMKPGDTVRLLHGKKTAVIRRLLGDVKGGVVLFDWLGGFRCWNVKDLKVVRCGKVL